MSFSRHQILGAAALSMLLSACQASGSATLTEEDYQDIAVGISGVIVDPNDGGDVASLNIAVDISIGLPPPGSIVGGSGAIDLAIGGVSYSWDVICKDESGAETYCGPETDSAEVTSTQSGSIDTLRYDATIEHSSNWKLSNILSGSPVIDGEGSASMSSEFTALLGKRSASFDFNYTASYDKIVISPDTNLPVQGKITYSVDATRTAKGPNSDVGSSYSVDVEVTFDGTSSATLTIDGKAQFLLNLGTGEVTST